MVIFCHTDLQRQFQNALKLTYGPTLGELFALILHFVWLYLFVTKMKMGVLGAAHAMTTSQLVSYLSMLFFQSYLVEKEHKVHLMVFMPKPKDILVKETLDQAGFSLICAIPSFFAWAAYEILVIFSSYLGAHQSAAFVISMQLENVSWACAYGI